jgi:hypothetical protein
MEEGRGEAPYGGDSASLECASGGDRFFVGLLKRRFLPVNPGFIEFPLRLIPQAYPKNRIDTLAVAL